MQGCFASNSIGCGFDQDVNAKELLCKAQSKVFWASFGLIQHVFQVILGEYHIGIVTNWHYKKYRILLVSSQTLCSQITVCNLCVGFGISLKLGIWQNKNPLKIGNYTIFWMFENPRRGRQALNFTTNVPKILDLKSSSEQIFSENWCWMPLTTQWINKLFSPTKL